MSPAEGNIMAAARSADTESHRRRAVTLARAAAEALDQLGVSVLVTGSLARGFFGPHSDIDFLVTSCPRHLKYAIEGLIEDKLDGIPFDVVYADEIPASKIARFTEGAVDARHLH
jgi:predicted nucleotidyltransferase